MSQQLATFYRMKQAAQYLSMSLSSLWRNSELDPDFPQKIRITARCCGYLRSDLDAYLAKKKGV